MSLLVPVLTEAKKRRQIIMVTHNPNLAVVCDAEQVIWSVLDRKNASKISYLVEDPPGWREAAAGKLYLAYLRDPDGNKLCALHRPPK